jgi:acetyltransferase-like isoleucine patch superfamily enzyme
MIRILALIFGESYWAFHSLFIKILLQAKGIQIGYKFRIHGIPYLKLKGKPHNISIGNNVFIGGDIDLRNRENGRIIIEDYVRIDDNCRLVSANDAVLRIGQGTSVGKNCIINCGTDVIIGEKCLFAGMVYINSSDHIISKGQHVIDQGYTHAPIIIEDGVFIGGFVSLKKGIIIKKGAVVGANSVVTKNISEYSVNVGIPAQAIKFRQ